MKYSKLFTIGLLGTMALAACSDNDDDWTPGDAYEVTNQVYFLNTEVNMGELDPNVSVSHELTMARDNGSGAITVPVTVSGEGWSVPTSVDFADGATTATIPVTFNPGTPGDYNCLISIEYGSYNSPYTEKITSVQMKATVVKWNLISDKVNVTSVFDYVPAFTCSLYECEGMNLYKLTNFTEGYDLKFELRDPEAGDYQYDPLQGAYVVLSDARYIYPKTGAYDEDWFGWGYQAWYFGDVDGEGYPLYFKGVTDWYLDWAIFFVGSEYASTYLRLPQKCGAIMWGGAFYDNAGNFTSSFYDYLSITWE